MATTNLGLTLPIPNFSIGWGTTLNTDFQLIDNVFAADGTGTSVGLNVGSGKTLNVGGTLVGGGTIILGGGDGTGTVTAPTIRGAARTGSNATGANLIIDAPNGTGTGGSGNFLFRTAAPGASGSTANSFQNAFSISNIGGVGIGTPYAGSKFEIANNDQFAAALNRTGGVGWKAGVQWQKNGAIKWEMGADIGNDGTNDFFVYDAVAASTRFMINPNGAVGFAFGSYGTSGQVLTSQGTGASPVWANVVTLTQGTAVNLAGLSTTTFSSLPAGIKTITVAFAEVKPNGGQDFSIRLGTSSGIASSNYISTSGHVNGAGGISTVDSTLEFVLNPFPNGTGVSGGTVTIQRISGNQWASSHSFGTRAGTQYSATTGGGYVTLPSELTQIQFRILGGTFDLGTVNIQYQ